MSRSAVALLSIFLAIAPEAVRAEDPSAQDLEQRTVHRRAVEAVIWGMSAVNYELMRHEMLTKTKGEVNQFIYWSKPADWRNQTLTPNPDAIYLMTFFDTKEAGPIVIEVPPAEGGSFAANIDDIWQVALEDAGPEGADKGRGGKYLVLPPGYSAPIPDGYHVLPSETYGGYALFRSSLPGRTEADFAKSVAYGKRLRIYPLSQATDPQATRFVDVREVVYDSTIPFDVRFFQSLNRIVQAEPWIERDRLMINQLKSLGIEKGKPFNPTSQTAATLSAAAKEAGDLLEQRYSTSVPTFFEGTQWRAAAQPEAVQGQSTRYATHDVYATDARGLIYTYGFIGIKRLGTAQYYLMAIRDRDGRSLSGANTYRLTVPANAPVEEYWSATAYDRATHALIKGMPGASRASQDASVEKNPDGSYDVWFGPKPAPGKEANWVPTKPGGEFEVLFRLYRPTKALFEKTWTLPDIERVAAQ